MCITYSMYERELELAGKAIEQGGLPPINKQDALDLIHQAYTHPDMFLSMIDDTILMGIITPVLYNQSYLIARDIFWYSEKPTKNGLKVLQEFEQWAKDKGANAVMKETNSNSPESVPRVYQRLGYKREGEVFMRYEQWD